MMESQNVPTNDEKVLLQQQKKEEKGFLISRFFMTSPYISTGFVKSESMKEKEENKGSKSNFLANRHIFPLKVTEESEEYVIYPDKKEEEIKSLLTSKLNKEGQNIVNSITSSKEQNHSISTPRKINTEKKSFFTPRKINIEKKPSLSLKKINIENKSILSPRKISIEKKTLWIPKKLNEEKKSILSSPRIINEEKKPIWEQKRINNPNKTTWGTKRYFKIRKDDKGNDQLLTSNSIGVGSATILTPSRERLKNEGIWNQRNDEMECAQCKLLAHSINCSKNNLMHNPNQNMWRQGCNNGTCDCKSEYSSMENVSPVTSLAKGRKNRREATGNRKACRYCKTGYSSIGVGTENTLRQNTIGTYNEYIPMTNNVVLKNLQALPPSNIDFRNDYLTSENSDILEKEQIFLNSRNRNSSKSKFMSDISSVESETNLTSINIRVGSEGVVSLKVLDNNEKQMVDPKSFKDNDKQWWIPINNKENSNKGLLISNMNRKEKEHTLTPSQYRVKSENIWMDIKEKYEKKVMTKKDEKGNNSYDDQEDEFIVLSLGKNEKFSKTSKKKEKKVERVSSEEYTGRTIKPKHNMESNKAKSRRNSKRTTRLKTNMSKNKNKYKRRNKFEESDTISTDFSIDRNHKNKFKQKSYKRRFKYILSSSSDEISYDSDLTESFSNDENKHRLRRSINKRKHRSKSRPNNNESTESSFEVIKYKSRQKVNPSKHRHRKYKDRDNDEYKYIETSSEDRTQRKERQKKYKRKYKAYEDSDVQSSECSEKESRKELKYKYDKSKRKHKSNKNMKVNDEITLEGIKVVEKVRQNEEASEKRNKGKKSCCGEEESDDESTSSESCPENCECKVKNNDEIDSKDISVSKCKIQEGKYKLGKTNKNACTDSKCTLRNIKNDNKILMMPIQDEKTGKRIILYIRMNK